jgi:enoyl-CoA hydratase/carnithine racemase
MTGFPKPLVCAVTGHSPAGGCLLALCCDYRVMAEGKYRIGLNEIPVGIVVPEPIFQLYSFWLGTARAYQFLIEGMLLPAREAVQAGLVNEACVLQEVETRAIAKGHFYSSFNQTVWSNSKLNFKKHLLQQLNPDFDAAFSGTLKQWWAQETRDQLKGMIEGLKQKNG